MLRGDAADAATSAARMQSIALDASIAALAHDTAAQHSRPIGVYFGSPVPQSSWRNCTNTLVGLNSLPGLWLIMFVEMLELILA